MNASKKELFEQRLFDLFTRPDGNGAAPVAMKDAGNLYEDLAISVQLAHEVLGDTGLEAVFGIYDLLQLKRGK